MRNKWVTPAGRVYDLFDDMLTRPHLLIAGATGTGKSVLINGLIYTALFKTPEQVQFILVDPKRVELLDYRETPHCLYYANDKNMINALQFAIDLIEKRYKEMESRHIKSFIGPRVYVVIDEMADLLTTNKREATPLIQRIAQIGRAAGVGLIAATQRPTNDVIGNKITVNLDCRVGLRTENKQDSRNIIGAAGCETLPDPLTEHKAQCIYKHGVKLEKWELPYIQQNTLDAIVTHWAKQNKRR